MVETAKPVPNRKLRYERERRGWSQQDVADKVGTTPLNVGRWERGVTMPGPHFRQKLCELFEKNIQQLGLVPESVDEKTSIGLVQASSISVSPALAEASVSLWNVPYHRNLFFTGREDVLAHLHEALTMEQCVALTQIQAISGLGGIGKTQTTIEYAYRYREMYKAVLWARADSYDLLISDFLAIAVLLNLVERDEQDQRKVVQAVMRWFDTHEQWLLILDNADDMEMVTEFIPPAGKGHILLTTRAQAIGTVAQRIELEKMGWDEGTLFLLRRTRRLKGMMPLETISEAIRMQARAIVEVVDGLPLALDQAGAYIDETGCSFTDYLKFYKTRRNRLLRTRGKDAAGHPEPVATTWSLSFEKVEQANPAAAELLRLCAFLHPDEIPERMIVEGASELGPILQPMVEDELDLNEAIGELRKYSLVKRDFEAKVLNIHRLVQAVVKDGMDKEVQREWAERTVRMVSKAFPRAADIATWPICQQYLPHAQICAELVKHENITSPEAIRLLHQTGHYLYERGQYKEAEPFLQQAVTLGEKIVGANNLMVAEALNSLGLVYDYQGKPELAVSIYQRVLVAIEQILGPDHFKMAETLNNLAVLYTEQGKYEQAEALHRRTHAILEKTLGPTHPDVAHPLHNLGVLYRHQGKYERAESFYQQALALREQTLGPDHLYVAYSLNGLALLHYGQAQYEQAEALFQRVLAIRERNLGTMHLEVLQTLRHLAVLYSCQGKYPESEKLFQRVITIQEQVLGTDHPEVAYTLSELAVLYTKQRRYEQAEALFQRALALQEHLLVPAHPDLARTLNDFALLYLAQNKYEQAEALFQRTLAIREQVLGAAHPHTKATLLNYANLLRQTGRETEALALEARI